MSEELPSDFAKSRRGVDFASELRLSALRTLSWVLDCVRADDANSSAYRVAAEASDKDERLAL